MMKNLIFLILCLFISFLLASEANAQQSDPISGMTTDGKDGGPVPNVSIQIKGTNRGTQTDVSGLFSINAKLGDTLIFRSIGYKDQFVVVGSRTALKISLQQDPKTLNEVVVVGYGEQGRSTLAGATSSVKASQFKDAVITSLDQAIQGRAAGVNIVQSSGEPGADVVFRIRGNNSLSGDNQPLIVVDGYPQPTYTEGTATALLQPFAANGSFGVNPNDIASIEILKDASSTAIYGSRGANGVVLITTKSGQKGQGKIEFSNKTTIGVLGKSYDMMTGKQYAQTRNELAGLLKNLPQFDLDTVNTSTDWFNAIVRRPTVRQNYNLNVSGGGPKSTYFIGADYLSEQGVIIRSNNRKGSIRANMHNEVTSWYTNNIQISISRQLNNRSVTSSRGFPNNGGPVLDAARATPIFLITYTGVDGGGRGGLTANLFNNPYLDLIKKTDLLNNDFSTANIENIFKFTKDLRLHITLGSTNVTSKRTIFLPPDVGGGIPTIGKASVGVSTTNSYNANAFLVHNMSFKGGHKLTTTLGGEYNINLLEQLGTGATGFNIPILGAYNLANAAAQNNSSYKQERVIESGFVRTNYSFKNKYVFNGSIRVDGASPFANDKKFGLFPAVGVAYNLMEENFMKGVKFLDNVKIRSSFGITGSQAIAPYSSLDRYITAFYQTGIPSSTVITLSPSTLENANLSWESTSQFNLGLDIAALNNRLTFTIDYYKKVTKDLLQARALPSQSGFTTIIDNYGKMGNKGIELSLGGEIIRNPNFKYSSSVNFSRNVNTLINLGTRTDNQFLSLGGNLQGGVSNVLIPGRDIGYFYGYEVTGLAQKSDFTNGNGSPKYPYIGNMVDQVEGGWKLADLNNDGKIDINDRKILGNATPKFTFGWTHDFTYKKLSVNILFTGAYGNDILNMTRHYLNSGLINNGAILFNQTQDWFINHYTPERPTTNVKYPGIQRALGTQDINSTMIEDGSYIRLKNVTLSYTLPSIKKIVKDPRIFFTGTNLFTLTRYSGFDPEVSSYGQSLLQQGIDYGSYPVTRTYTVGLNFSF